MSRMKALLRLAVAGAVSGALAAGLAGCVSLLPKSKPAQLYRLTPTVATKGVPTPGSVGVFDGGGEFQPEAAGDRIVTVTNSHIAYIAQSRWAAPAQVMFERAMDTAFEGSGGHVRLVPRGAPAPTDYVLRVDVRNFEARYDAGEKAAPIVVVRVHAALARDRNRSLVSETVFEARVTAADNRVSAIVAAFSQATGQVLDQLVGWTNEKAVPGTPAAA